MEGLPYRYEDRKLCVIFGILSRSHAVGQVEANVVMDLNKQSQEQLRVDTPDTAHTAVDGQELTQATGCLGVEGRGLTQSILPALLAEA